ncbi:sensor histidine kinase [Clostridium ganghwense]|uniref:histidine kinase n=1 Tax=Clostridium ganghwense TaxID=312089 RepID=A0ABT4CWH9_9CLOT|nr:HAMP domain-containing sensor histidine kinase [Clostridium ganghwense]MCY6372778.1 HAMP domain-containing sensor histidine kinase [Clostridium ganghwense]
MKLKIKTKIMLMNMGILIPVIIFIYLVIINNLYNNVLKNSVDFLTKESYNTQLYIINYLGKDSGINDVTKFKNISPLTSTYLSNRLKFRIQMYDKDGNITADSSSSKDNFYDKDINNAIKGNKAYIIRKVHGKMYILFSSPIYINDKTIGCVRYIYEEISGNKLIHNTFIIMGIIAIIAICLAWVLSNLFSDNIVRPIEKLKDMSEKVAKRQFNNKIDINSGDEIEDLSKTFNIMSENIQQHIEKLKEEKQKQKSFLDNVTHEFKTPLTAIIGHSDLIPRLNDKEDVEESLSYIGKEGQRLLKLVEELLDLSKFGKNEFEIHKTNSDIKEVVEEVLYMLKPRCDKYDIYIEKELFSKEIFIDKDKTKQVILNVVDNAIKYSECSSIIFNIEENNEYIILSIIDDGMGIAEEYIDKIFEPFCRVNKISAREKNGNGLGLFICREIMNKQDGFIEISSKLEKWTCVKLGFKK